MPDSATLIWFLGKNNTTGDHFAFEYSPSSGVWSIIEGKNKDWNKLVTGITYPTPIDTPGTIMFVVDGDLVSAFYGDAFLNSVIMSHGSTGGENLLAIRDNSSQFAQADITKIRFWNLDAVEWLGTDWITARPESVLIDSFTGNEGLQFNPVENEKYEDGKAVLFTMGGETGLTRDDLQGENIALEVSFVPRTMPDNAWLVLVMGEDTTTLDCVEFSYFSKTGEWQITKVVNRQWEQLSSGMTQPTPEGTGVTIMVVTYSDHVDVYLNQDYLGSAQVDRSGAGSRNELVLRSKENQYARADIYLIRSWNLPVDEPASGEGTASLSETINSLTDGRPPDFQDDFSSATLQEYWSSDQGAQEGTLQDGALRLKNENLIGQDTLNKMNYILQVDLRFGGISPDENFFYGIRTTEFQNGKYGSEYLLNINPSNGEWAMNVITDPHGQWTGIQKGNLGLIEAGRWYELGIVVNTDSIQTFWDDQLFLTQDSVVLYGLVNHFGLDPSRAVESATVDIDNWRFWELETPPYMQNDWISETTPTVQEDNFIADEGWQFSPPENEKYQDGAAVLYTNGGETGLTREDIHGTNFAMDVTFSPRDMPDTASLVWFLRKDTSTSESLEFEYFPATGFWKIRRTENKNNLELASGWNQPTDQDKKGTIMVLVDGDRVSAFLGDAFLGYAESSNPVAGTWNELVIRSGEAAHAEMDISSIRFWDLNTLKWSNYDLLTSGEPTFVDDNFTKGEGWIFDPAEMEKYEGGNAILTTNGGKSTPTTALTRTGLQGVKLALEVTFIPRTLSDTARLLWVLKVNYTSWCEISLTYFPTTGVWEFGRFNYHAPEALGNGSTQTVPVGSSARIMVATDGEHISAFYNGVFFGTATTTSSCFGALNQIGLADEGEAFSQVDITKITFWKLDD
jgi:hypothetical protein